MQLESRDTVLGCPVAVKFVGTRADHEQNRAVFSATFRSRPHVVMQWLAFFEAHNPYYADVVDAPVIRAKLEAGAEQVHDPAALDEDEATRQQEFVHADQNVAEVQRRGTSWSTSSWLMRRTVELQSGSVARSCAASG
jgi:hypothetical protein